MKFVAPALALIFAAGTPSMVLAQATATPAPAAHYSVTDTDIGTLLDDPAAKAVLDKYIAGFSSNPQIDMARSMTLKAVQQYAPDMLSDQALANIQTDLNKLPVKK